MQVQAYQQAAHCYEEVLLHSPQSIPVYIRYAEIMYTLGGVHLKTARQYYAAALKLSNGEDLRALYGICCTAAALSGQKVGHLTSSNKRDSSVGKQNLDLDIGHSITFLMTTSASYEGSQALLNLALRLADGLLHSVHCLQADLRSCGGPECQSVDLKFDLGAGQGSKGGRGTQQERREATPKAIRKAERDTITTCQGAVEGARSGSSRCIMIIYHASLNLNASGKNQKATLATVKWT